MEFGQGDIIELNFDPTVGHEPKKERPALVIISNDSCVSCHRRMAAAHSSANRTTIFP
jgi:mRNA-degrading endonuclease toxin of MazEF toxin-antitoxin module